MNMPTGADQQHNIPISHAVTTHPSTTHLPGCSHTHGAASHDKDCSLCGGTRDVVVAAYAPRYKDTDTPWRQFATVRLVATTPREPHGSTLAIKYSWEGYNLDLPHPDDDEAAPGASILKTHSLALRPGAVPPFPPQGCCWNKEGHSSLDFRIVSYTPQFLERAASVVTATVHNTLFVKHPLRTAAAREAAEKRAASDMADAILETKKAELASAQMVRAAAVDMLERVLNIFSTSDLGNHDYKFRKRICTMAKLSTAFADALANLQSAHYAVWAAEDEAEATREYAQWAEFILDQEEGAALDALNDDEKDAANADGSVTHGVEPVLRAKIHKLSKTLAVSESKLVNAEAQVVELTNQLDGHTATANAEFAQVKKKLKRRVKKQAQKLAATEAASQATIAELRKQLEDFTAVEVDNVDTGEVEVVQLTHDEAVRKHRKRDASTALVDLAETAELVVRVKKEKISTKEELEDRDDLAKYLTLYSDRLVSHIDVLKGQVKELGGVPMHSPHLLNV
jgi:hypothetical protein